MGPPWLPGDSICIHLCTALRSRWWSHGNERHLGCSETLIQNLVQEALGVIKAAASLSWHVMHTPLWALLPENNSVRTLGEIVPSEKTSKGLRGQRGCCLASPSRTLPCTLPICICRLKAWWSGPCDCGQQPSPETRLHKACLSCCLGHLTVAPQLSLGAPFFPWPLRPAWTRVLTGPGSQTLSLQVAMSQGSWDLWSHLLHRPHPMTTPLPLPLLDLELQGAVGAASQLEVWALPYALQFSLISSSGLMTLALCMYLSALNCSSALTGLLPGPQSKAGKDS